MSRPLIGVTGPDKGHHMSWNFIAASLALAGARMQRLMPGNPRYGKPLDGLIISGGKDIDPLLYGKERKSNYTYDHARDALERQWIERAAREKIPLLGICRGAQLLNVCLGGTLYMDIRLVCETAKYPDTVWSKVFVRKPVNVTGNSLLHGILMRDHLYVNSLHKQSLEQIGEGLRVTVKEENGIVQGVESTLPDWFVLGVQWHPEFMIESARQRRIFTRLVAETVRHQGQAAFPAVDLPVV